ncbi:SRPBCC family protein [Paenibacillus sp. FJAT-27812]|uniref:SRPBCC family protein n=1 Tax=Paenibacillus sp. FJAT-27812 TaxID=1684143 RepID=UPI0006A7B1C2|nr:SRPBCC family protein [Paenibacillus sp. FJAT-27812]
MNERFVKHATFVVERTYAASPERVYNAWANQETKAKWFSKAEIFDFQVGGREYSSGGPPEGPIFDFNVIYQEIVPEQRIVYTYTLDTGGKRVSVSITTVELIPVEAGTMLVLTEQGAFFDGLDTPEVREHGTNEMLKALGKALAEGDDDDGNDGR